MSNISNRNENIPLYFETLYTGIAFLDLIKKDSKLLKIEVKPDRKYGAARRIEDLTKFYSDNSVEVVQIKHSIDNGRKIGFGDLWVTKGRQSDNDRTNKFEGKNVFKFLKSWREHKALGKAVTLTLASNRTPNQAFTSFLSDIEKFNTGKLLWSAFQQKYSSEIKAIRSNCNRKPFKNNSELKNFLKSFRFEKLPNWEQLESGLAEKLKNQGVITKDRVEVYIHRTNKTFISNEIEILPQRIVELIDRMKTGLLQEISLPENFVERLEIERKILKEIEAKKRTGGFVYLFAPSGAGKTVLLSRLSSKYSDFFPYFCRIRPFETVKGQSGYSNKNRLNSTWFKVDIIQRCHEFGLLEASVGLNDDEFYIDKMFDEALKTLSEKAQKRPSKKIVIIVDALDQIETDKYTGKSVLDAIPTVNYPGIVFLLSTWGANYLPQSIKNLPAAITKKIGIELFFTDKEIKQYYSQTGINLSQDQVSLIQAKTSGLAISLFYLNKLLKKKKDIDNIIHSINNFTEVFDWYKPIWEVLKDNEKECLGYLCFHFASVKRDSLRDMIPGLSIAQFNSLLRTIDHFLDTSSGFLQPYHDSFRRFIVNRFSGDKKEFHQKLAKYYSSHTQLPYSRKFLTRHLQVVGIATPFSKNIFGRLHTIGFFKKILKSKLDDDTKVEIGRTFVDYFFYTKNVKEQVQYSIITSGIYPSIYDSDVYDKARIGTKKLLSDIEQEVLFSPKDHLWNQQDWIFKRLSLGNILISRRNKNGINLAKRFIDDGLFRIALNRNLLWGDEQRHNLENHLDIYTCALVNAGRYAQARNFLRKGISFKNPSPKMEGVRCYDLATINIQNLNINPKETLRAISKAPKLERLITYLEMEGQGIKVPNKSDFRKLLTDIKLERFLHSSNSNSQFLNLAEALFVHKINDWELRINKLLDKVKIEIPYHHHSYTFWGSPDSNRSIFLRWITLKGLTDKNFKISEYYNEAFKKKFENRSDHNEYNSKGLLEVLTSEQALSTSRILVLAGKQQWNNYIKLFEITLKQFKQKVDELNSYTDHSYLSDEQKNLYPFSQDLYYLIEENLDFLNSKKFSKYLTVLDSIELTLNSHLFESAELLETICEVTVNKTSQIQNKLLGYLNKASILRQREALDNLGKSSNLRKIAVLAAQAGYPELAQNIFDMSLKYSKGLWSKGDLRFINLVDALRTQNPGEFDLVLDYINKISDVVEGSWYWKLDFIESAVYADFEMALQYCYLFISKGECNQNEALRRIVSTYIKFYPKHTIVNILPFLDLMDVTEESTYEYLEVTTNVFFDIIKWFLVNANYTEAEKFVQKYVYIVKKDVEPDHSIRLLNRLLKILERYTQLIHLVRKIKFYINELKQGGYKEATTSNSYDGREEYYGGLDMLKLEKTAQQYGIEKLIKQLTKYLKTDFHYLDKAIPKLSMCLNNSEHQILLDWAKSKNIRLDQPEIFATLMEKAAKIQDRVSFQKIVSQLIKYINETERGYEIYSIINALDKQDFNGKKALMKRLMLLGIRKLSGSSYSLSEFFYYSSDAIDKHFIDLKKFSYPAWKQIVERAIKLSLSK